MRTKTRFIALTGLLALVLSGSAQADRRGGGHHHHHVRPGVGFYFGAPIFPRPYFYPYYDPFYYPYYPPAVVEVPVEPPVYIERERPPVQNQALPEGYWYYCNNPEGYYPYIKECPSGWQQVAPTPQQ